MPVVPVRRPRMTAARQAELLGIVIDLIEEVGYDALTMDAVAARGRCSKATLYRQWPGKLHLVVAALHAISPDTNDDVDTGALRSDLLALFRHRLPQAEQESGRFIALGHVIQTNADLAEAVRTTLVEPDIALILRFVDRAVARGELAHRPAAADFLPDLMFAALVVRPLFDGFVPDAAYLTRYVDTVLLPALHNS